MHNYYNFNCTFLAFSASGLLLAFATALSAQPYPNTTNTNAPVFVGPTNLSAKVGDSFLFQTLVGGVNRGWVGSGSFSNGLTPWITIQTNRGTFGASNSQLVFRPASTNSSQPAIGILGWANPLPLNQSWLAYVQTVVSTNLGATSGRSALAYLQLFQSNQPAGSGTFSNSSRVGWGRGFANSSSNTLISDFQSHNSPYGTTNFSSNEASFYTLGSGSSQASLVFSNLGNTNNPTNRLVYRANTNGTVFAGAPGPAAALAMPALLLPSATSWQVTATVNIDPSKIREWHDENQGFSIGLNLARYATNQTPLQLMANRVALEFGWQGNGGSVYREAFQGGTNVVDAGYQNFLFGSGNLEAINTVRLLFSYDASTKILSSYFEDPVDGWVPADYGLNLSAGTGSLGEAWNFDAEKGLFYLILSANSNYTLYDDERLIGAGNTIGEREVPIFFSDLEVVVQPENAAPVEIAGDSCWLILKYDATTRELIQGYAANLGDPLTLPETVFSLNAWATNAPLQLRLGASSAQTNNPANGIRFGSFSVIPGEGQLAYSLVDGPDGFEIDSDLGTVTATNLPNAGLTSFTVLASNLVSGLTATQTFRLDVGPATPRLAVTSSNLPLRYGSNTASALVVTAVNTNELGTNPIILSAPNLPAGLSFTTTSNSLTIRGTPTTVTGGTSLVITASNLAGTATLTSSITIQPAVPRLQLAQNRPNPQYSLANVAGWSNAYWTLRVSNTAGQNTGAFPNVITVSNLPPGLLFRTEGSLLAGPGGTATNTGIISLATNRITNAGIYSNVVFTASNISGVSTLTSTIMVLPTVPVLALVTNASGATNSGTLSNPVFLNLAFGSSNANWFRITNSLDVPVTYTMQDAPRGLVINPSNGVVSGRIDQAINATNVVFRGTNSAGVSSVLRARISTLPPAPLFSVTNRPSSNGVATDVLTLTVSNFSSMGATSIQWSTAATSATNSQGNSGRFSLATNANRNVFTIRTTTNSTNAGIYSNVTVTASNSGGVTVFTTNLVVLPEIPSLTGLSNLATPPQFGEPSTNALQVSLDRPSRQNLADFPVTFLPVTNLPESWTLNTNSSSAWISSAEATEATLATLRFRATNAAGTNSIDLVLRVLPLVPEIAVTTNSNRLQFGSSNSTNYLTLGVESFGQNTNQFPVTWRISNAPPGVSLSTTNNSLVNFVGGVNPTRAGVFSNVQIIASNTAGSTTNFLDLTVFPQLPQIRIATNRVQHGLVNPNVLVLDVTNANPSNSLGLGSAGFGISFLASNPPASLSFTTNSATNAVLGGTPNLSTNATFTLTVSNLAGAISTNMNLRILPAVPVFGVVTNRAQFGSNSPAALVVTVINTNGGAQNTNDFPISFSVSPALAGLGFTNTNGNVGTYGGTNPAVVTNARLTVVVSNAAGATTNTNVNLAVLPALPLFSVTNQRTQFGTNSPNALVVTVTNTAGQNTNPGQFPSFTFSSPNLPLGQISFTNTNGLTASAGSTNPNLATNAIITVVVSNAVGATTNTNVSLQVLPALPAFTLVTNRAQVGVNSPGALIATVNNPSGQNTNNFPISFSVTPALAGLGFTNTNGLVGTYGGTNPAVVTNTILTVVASNAGGAITNSTNFSVLPGFVTFTNLGSLPEGRHGSPYNNSASFGFELRFDPAVQNDTNYSISHTNLPPGLRASKSDFGARIRGTNTSAGIFSNCQVIFSNAGVLSTNTFTMRILPAAPEFSVTNNGAIFGVGTANALVVTVTNTTRQNTNDFPIGISVSPAVPGLALSRVDGFRGNYGGTNPSAVTNAALTVTVTNAGGTNQTNVTLVVAKGNNTITFGALPTNKVFGDPVFGVSATADSGLAVSLSSANTNVATVLGTNVTIVGAGTAQIVASQAGNSNFVAAANVTNNLVVGKATPGITWDPNPAPITYGTLLSSNQLNASSPVAGVFTYDPTNGARLNAGTNRLTAVFNATNTTNYSSPVTNTVNLVVNQASNVITFGALPSKVYGSPVFGVSAVASSGLAVSFSSGNTNVAAVSGTNVTIVGAGTAPIAASQSGDSNFAAATSVTQNLVVEGGVPEVVGPNSNNISFRTNQVFSYQISARSAGQFWAGRSDFPDNGALTNSWLTNGMANSEASLNSTNNGYLQYRWSTNAATFAYLEWSQPLPADSGWLASVTVNFATNNGTNYVVADLTGLGLTEGEYLYGMLSAFRDATDTNNVVDAVFGGNSNQPTGFTSALAITNGTNVIEGIGTNSSSASYGWIGLQTTTNGGTNRLLVLGNPYSNSPVWWSTNLALPISTWTNAARSNTLVLRLSGNSLAPTNGAYALEFSQFTVVPLGQLGYDWDVLPAGLDLDRETGLITGIPTSTNNTISTITITNSHGTTNIILNFTHDNE